MSLYIYVLHAIHGYCILSEQISDILNMYVWGTLPSLYGGKKNNLKVGEGGAGGFVNWPR